MYAVYLVVGAFAGLMGGLFGIGGGVIIIPALATIFEYRSDIPTADIMQMAVGTSLATIVITGISSIIAHHRLKGVIWPQVFKMTPWLVSGAILGALVALILPSHFLKIFFGVFLMAISIKLLMKKPDTPYIELSKTVFRGGSFLIGVLASVLGVGGGTMIVPFLLQCNLDMPQATGTSVACGMSIGLIASVCFMITGLLAGVHLPHSTGYIYWPAFLGIAVASVLFAPFGAMLAHRLPKDLLKKIFAFFLFLMALDMLFLGR